MASGQRPAPAEHPLILRPVDSGYEIPDSFDATGRHWLLVGLTVEADELIEELASRTGDTKATLINKALGLYKAASDASREGKQVGIADGQQELETEFVGF